MGFTDDTRFRRAFMAVSALLVLGVILFLVALGVAANREASRTEGQAQTTTETVAPAVQTTLKPEANSTLSFRDVHDDGLDCSTCHVPRHTAISPCTDCHVDTSSGWVVQHPYFSNCEGCHSRPTGHYQGSCSTCHKTTDNFYAATYTHTSGTNCSLCHTPPHEKKAGTCSSCHPRSGDSWVFVHTSAPSCGNCHQSPKNHYGAGCSSCHASPIAASTTWRLGCNTSGCHTLSTSAKHIPLVANELCVECHDQGSLADIHLGAVISIGGATQRSCLVCHSPAAPAISGDCQSCHADMFTPTGGWIEHGYMPESHLAAPGASVIDINGTVYGPLNCDGCHDLDLRDEHFKNTSSSADGRCVSCHPSPKATLVVWEKGCQQAGCHVEGGPAELHGEIDADHAVAPEDALTCEPAGCHIGDKALLHGNMENGCGACHAAGVPSVVGCGACHDDKFNDDGSANIGHAFDEVTHMADPPSEHINVSGTDLGNYQCSLCHDYRIGEEHEKATSSSTGVGCQNCHPTPRTTFADWDKSCAQAGCHELATGAEKHLLIDSAHELSLDMQASCQQDCHTGSTAEIHLYASTTIDEVVVMGCLVCHSEGIPAPAECTECHATPHEGADHSATRDSCGLAGCHDGGAPDELHATCMQCHSVTPLPASTMCLECHTVTEPHDAFAANHVGDVSDSARSRSIPGCGGIPWPGRANYVGLCHDVSNTMKLHENVHSRNDGCPVCHGPGKLLSNKCTSCHVRRSTDLTPGAEIIDGNTIHHSNNKYLTNPDEIIEGSYANGTAAGFNSKLSNYDCQFCHWGFFYGSKPAIPEQRSPYSGGSMWYGGLRTGAGGLPTDTTLQIPGTFVASADMALEYMVNYQGRVTDYGYTEVSTDGGVTWATVPGNITSVAPVSGTHLGNGISGNSITWTQATFSLAAYDGQTISLRLRYKTPWQSVAPGFGYAVDDIELLEGGTLLFSDGAEDEGTGMITANWLRTGIYPPAYAPDDPNNAP